MKLTANDCARLRSWNEGERCERDESRPNDEQHLKPMLPRVAFDIVARLTRQSGKKTARGQLRAAKQAIDLVLNFLEART